MTDATAQITSQQVDQLITALTKIADKQMLITSAADWPMLYILVGLTLTIIMIFGGLMWNSLGAKIETGMNETKSMRDEWKTALSDHRGEIEKKFDDVWAQLRRCESRCCDKK